MTNDQRQACFYSFIELRDMLRDWNATSDVEKRAIIQDAMANLATVPPPDDMQED